MTNSRTIRRVAAMSTGAVIATAGLAPAALASNHTPVFTHKDSGRTVHLAAGTVFKIKLKTCTDCGDSWHWVHKPSPHRVKVLSKQVVSHVKPPAVGGEATTIYRLKVIKAVPARMVLVEKGPAGQAISHFRLSEAPLVY